MFENAVGVAYIRCYGLFGLPLPIPTPFHSRTFAVCTSQEWRDWSGYIAAAIYEPTHEHEYYAIRNSAALIDVTPLFKYDFTGSETEALVNRIITRDASKCQVGQVMYTGWCDEHGKLIDDGTVQRLAKDHFRVTAADPSLRWFQDCGFGFDVSIKDISSDLAALALQGPNSRKILKQVVSGVDVTALKFFCLAAAEIDGIPLTISRTGYTGDLGYELWVEPRFALRLWDVLMETGRDYGITPAGLVALDMARIEAGLLLIEVDYVSSFKALTEHRKSSPFEAGLGWTVKLDAADFVGRRALLAEKKVAPRWQLVGLEINWEDLEEHFAAQDLPPLVAGRASRLPTPIYKRRRQIGYATSSTFSPILKKYIALATVEGPHAGVGTEVDIELTVEFSRRRARATIVKTPFFDPARKRA